TLTLTLTVAKFTTIWAPPKPPSKTSIKPSRSTLAIPELITIGPPLDNAPATWAPLWPMSMWPSGWIAETPRHGAIVADCDTGGANTWRRWPIAIGRSSWTRATPTPGTIADWRGRRRAIWLARSPISTAPSRSLHGRRTSTAIAVEHGWPRAP